jgi:hypothetical protein
VLHIMLIRTTVAAPFREEEVGRKKIKFMTPTTTTTNQSSLFYLDRDSDVVVQAIYHSSVE